MKTISLEVVRRDRIKVELDPEFFNEEWFEDFREVFYDLYELEELAEHIAYNAVHNNETFIEGVGIPLHYGKRPVWVREDNADINEHVNIIFNPMTQKLSMNRRTANDTEV